MICPSTILQVADDLSRVLGRFPKYPLHLSKQSDESPVQGWESSGGGLNGDWKQSQIGSEDNSKKQLLLEPRRI